MGHQRTTLMVDRDAAQAAREELGTKTLTETVNASLREVAARAARRRFIAQLPHTDLNDADVMRSAWL